MSALTKPGARRLRRVIAVASHARGRIAELVPPRAERCGTSPAVGAPRVLVASLRQMREHGGDAVVSLDGGPLIGVDLGTPHGRRLFAYGFCEPAARFMRSLLEPGDAVVDGGANIGLFSLVAAAGVGSRGRVIACEPSPATMRLLRANVDRNHFDCVELREVALAAAPGRSRLCVFGPGSGFSSFAPADATSGVEVEVEVATLDDVASEVLERLKLVKLDVEGAELRALHGASRVLHKARPDFIVELEPQHIERQGGSIAEVQDLFDAAGYVGYSIGDRGLQRLPHVWQRPAGDPNIVVRPRER